MSNVWTKKMSRLLIMAILVSFLPVTSLNQAAAAPSLYFQFNTLSDQASSPTTVNSGKIDVSGSFSGVTSSTITFKVEKIVNGVVKASSNGAITPVLTSSTFLFPGVELFEGYNKITVTALNSAGNTVEGAAYAQFLNVPVITQIKLADNRQLVDGQPLLVASANPGVVVTTSNVTEVTVNGTTAFPGGGGTFTAMSLNLTPGFNQLVIVAKNGGKTYTQNRQVIFYDNMPTVYNVMATNGSVTQALNGNPTFDMTGSTTFTGRVSFAAPSPAPTGQPALTFDLLKNGTSVKTGTATVTQKVYTNPGYVDFDFKTDALDAYDFDPLAANREGKYTLRIISNGYGAKNADFPVTFRIKDATSPYIDDIRQLYNVSAAGAAGSTATFGTSTQLVDNITVLETPLWAQVLFKNGSGSTAPVVTAKQNGVALNAATFQADVYKDSLGVQNIVKISKMPAGEVQLDFTVGSDTISKTIQYVPVPSIQLTNVVDGDIFHAASGSGSLQTIDGKLLNFNLTGTSAGDENSLTILINGKSYSMTSSVDTATGRFSFTNGDPLVPGPNNIKISGTANGVPVATSLTVFYLSSVEPAVTSFRAVPYDATTPQINNDKGTVTQVGTTSTYTTEDSSVDIIFKATQVEKLYLKEDGKDIAMATVAGVISSNMPAYLVVEKNTDVYEFRIRNASLPMSGSKSFTIQVTNGTANISQTITVTRELPPYKLLSPKLPEEKVVNQNFLNVVIRAEGAESIAIGKALMVKDPGSSYVFRYRYEGLKAGSNTVKFTVTQGTKKTNGQFVVNYAADSSVGAQFVTTLPSSGKVTAFKGNLSLQFPKNTFLEAAAPNTDAADLFDAQKILLGIADKTDGRTVKLTNIDGAMIPVPANPAVKALLSPLSHFGMASDMYWIDPGYVSTDSVLLNGTYTYVDGNHPYASSAVNLPFFSRNDPKYWLKPSQRGKITIKYDPNLRNAAAKNLSIWRYSGGRWENVGGIVDTGKKTVTADFDGFGYYAVQTLRFGHNDVIGHEYARNSLELLYSRGVMDAESDNEFGVYDNITRGEFAQVMVKMLRLPLDYDPNDLTFDDVPNQAIPGALWDYRYIETAVRKGIIRGKGPRLFLPNEPLTREEAAVMIARATNLLKGKENADKDKLALQKQFTDGNLIGYYSVSAVLAVTKAGYITGLPNTATGTQKASFRFDPLSNLKRADAAIIAERVMTKAKLL